MTCDERAGFLGVKAEEVDAEAEKLLSTNIEVIEYIEVDLKWIGESLGALTGAKVEVAESLSTKLVTMSKKNVTLRELLKLISASHPDVLYSAKGKTISLKSNGTF